MRDYGYLLRKYRKEHGISQTQCAKAIGIHQPVLSSLESGKLKAEYLGESKIAEIEEYLGIKDQTAEELLEKIIESVEEKEDMIHSPKHYQIPGCEFEVIDLIDAFVDDLPSKWSVRVGNVVKYLARAEKKNGNQDYKKAKEYLEMAIDLGKDVSGCTLDEIAQCLGTDWVTIITGICEKIPTGKALFLNEAFKFVAGADYEEAIKIIDKLLEM